MYNLILIHEHRILEQSSDNEQSLNLVGYDATNFGILDQFSRTLPTKLHYAAASLVAWLGGTQNLQYFCHCATSPQIRRPEQNQRYGKKCGYSPIESKELDESGLILVPNEVLLNGFEIQGTISVIGGIPIDEVNAVNLPKAEFSEKLDTENHHGVLVDKHYRAPFKARPLKSQALYGARDVYRDHYTAFYKETTHVGAVRCKHYCAPILQASNFAELKEIAAKVPRRGDEGIVFRGQTQFYLLDRAESAKQFPFGESCSDEPSFGTSASRQNFDYDSLHFGIAHYLENYGIDFPRTQGSMGDDIYEAWRKASVSPGCEVDYAIMALAQHYGLPSHGLDVTESINVAAWFATNKYVPMPDGRVTYQCMNAEDWSKDPQNWPVVGIFQPVTNSLSGSLQSCHELEQFGLTPLRPSRQSAKFFLGGHSDHQNRLAEALVCLVRLKPGEYLTGLDFNGLFPDEDEDQAYKIMLSLANYAPLQAIGGSKVAHFQR
jgi:hypothetical protein